MILSTIMSKKGNTLYNDMISLTTTSQKSKNPSKARDDTPKPKLAQGKNASKITNAIKARDDRQKLAFENAINDQDRNILYFDEFRSLRKQEIKECEANITMYEMELRILEQNFELINRRKTIAESTDIDCAYLRHVDNAISRFYEYTNLYQNRIVHNKRCIAQRNEILAKSTADMIVKLTVYNTTSAKELENKIKDFLNSSHTSENEEEEITNICSKHRIAYYKYVYGIDCTKNDNDDNETGLCKGWNLLKILNISL